MDPNGHCCGGLYGTGTSKQQKTFYFERDWMWSGIDLNTCNTLFATMICFKVCTWFEPFIKMDVRYIFTKKKKTTYITNLLDISISVDNNLETILRTQADNIEAHHKMYESFHLNTTLFPVSDNNIHQMTLPELLQAELKQTKMRCISKKRKKKKRFRISCFSL